MDSRRILLMVSGGIAAYKAPELVRTLRRSGHEVRCALTPEAGRFVSSLSLQAVSGASVRQNLFDPGEEGEIDHIGLKHHLASRDVTGWPVVHLGASVAAIERDSTGPAGLGDQRMVLTTADGEVRDEIGRRVLAANWRLTEVHPWPGEGGTWFEAGASVLSFLGGSSLFHTTADTAAAATTPQAMALAAEVAIDAARLFRDTHR